MASKRSVAAVPAKFVIVTLDAHLAGAFDRAKATLARELPGLELRMHVAADYMSDEAALARAKADIAQAHFVVTTQLFTEESAGPVREALAARQPECDAFGAALCVTEVMRLTRMGRFSMADEDALLFFTDCLPDARNGAGEEFGVGRIEKAFSASGTGLAAEKLATIMEAFQSFVGDATLNDDLTVIVLQRTNRQKVEVNEFILPE